MKKTSVVNNTNMHSIKIIVVVVSSTLSSKCGHDVILFFGPQSDSFPCLVYPIYFLDVCIVHC